MIASCWRKRSSWASAIGPPSQQMHRTYVALFTPYLYTPSKPLEPVQNGDIFARRVSVAEASEFMIGDVVPPLTQLIHDQADIRHGKELILCTMCDIDRQVVRLGTTLVWPEYPGHDRQASKALRPGKAHFITERAPIRQARKKSTRRIDIVALLELVQDEHEGRRIPRKPDETKRFSADEQVATTFGIFEPRPQKILVVATP